MLSITTLIFAPDHLFTKPKMFFPLIHRRTT